MKGINTQRHWIAGNNSLSCDQNAMNLVHQFFKVRYIYNYTGCLRPETTNVIRIPLGAETIIDVGNNYDLNMDLKTKKNKKFWELFLYCEKEIIKGYSFLHIPKEKEYYDSLYTLPNESRECGTYVYPEFRGQGIRGKILARQIEYSIENNRTIWAVIEKFNIASIRSALKCSAKRTKTNLLLKFMGKNVFSITTNPVSVIFCCGRNK